MAPARDIMLTGTMSTRNPSRAGEGIRPVVGRNLRWVREIVADNITGCARMMGVDPGTWHMWETGKRYPDIEVMTRFCQEIGITLDYLYRSDLRGVREDVQCRLAAAHRELELPPLAGSFRAKVTGRKRARAPAELCVASSTNP